MRFREALEHIKGLRHVLEEMAFSSSIGRLALLDSSWLTNQEEIEDALDEVAKFVGYINTTEGIPLLQLQLEEVVNIFGSIEVLRATGAICSDVDLFEIKKLALIDEKIAQIQAHYHYQLYARPSLKGVLSVLDPREERLPSFYLDNYFDASLKEIRDAIARTKEDAPLAELNAQLSQCEEAVRIRLTEELAPFADQLETVLKALAHDTAILAKADWAVRYRACRPKPIPSGTTHLEALVNPEVSDQVARRGGRFQPVSIEFEEEPTLISGANMGGKSVLLHSVALAQGMMQFGMYVLAKSATMVVVEQLLYSAGDGEDMRMGLSSFGAEMIRLNGIIDAVKSGKKVLAIIDEPARTTNPEEGYALVAGLVKLLEQYGATALITTHYSGVPSQGRRWRVRGFMEDKDMQGVEVSHLADLMDYSLVPDSQDSVPREAFRIARLLGVDEEFLDLSNKCFRTIV